MSAITAPPFFNALVTHVLKGVDMPICGVDEVPPALGPIVCRKVLCLAEVRMSGAWAWASYSRVVFSETKQHGEAVVHLQPRRNVQPTTGSFRSLVIDAFGP